MDFNFNDSIPIYIQLIDKFKIAIATGYFKTGEKLPSVRELSTKMKVNPNTIQRALNELENDKLIFTKRTSGKFVSDDDSSVDTLRKKIAYEKIDAFTNSMNELMYDKADILKMINERED